VRMVSLGVVSEGAVPAAIRTDMRQERRENMPRF
jgi:hypothetical protein